MRDHTQEYKVKNWRKTDNPKWRRFVEYFAQVRKEDRWKKDSNMGYNDVVIEFENLENKDKNG